MSLPLQGARLTELGGLSIYVFFQNDQPMNNVVFWLDDPDRLSAPIKVEAVAPYDLQGTVGGLGLPMPIAELGDGVHTLTVQANLGDLVHLETVSFAVDRFFTPLPGIDRPSWDGLPGPSGEMVFAGQGGQPQELDGSTVSLADDEDPVWVAASDVDYVHYWVDDPDRSGPGIAADELGGPYVFDKDALQPGPHTLTVVATRGVSITEQTLSFTVEP